MIGKSEKLLSETLNKNKSIFIFRKQDKEKRNSIGRDKEESSIIREAIQEITDTKISSRDITYFM